MLLTPRQKHGLCKVGDALLPGGDGLPSFSASDAVIRIDRLLLSLPPSDRAGLCQLFGLFSFFPRPFLAVLLRICRRLGKMPGVWGAPFRLVGIGVKGAVYSLYYAEPQVLRAIGWDAK